MKKTRKALAAITSLVMFACASLATMSTDAAVVTDNTRSEFESGEETVKVKILFNFDAKILDKVKGEAHQKAEELSKEYYDSLDVLKYTEPERLSMQREYFNVNYERLSKELTEKAKKDLAKPVLEDIGVDITDNIEYPNYGFILCELNKDQLLKAENSDIIKSVSVDKDWNNESYIGTPSIYPVLTGTTTTYANSTYTTTTTSVYGTPSLATTLEYYGNDMFTDIIKDIDDFTIQFENHGKYRFLSSAIKDQLIHYKIGDEITIRFEYLRVNDTDTPRIDNILMLKCTNIPLGDVNRDRLIDAIDASIILANYAKYSTSSAKPAESELAEQDVNGDGFIDAVDASSVLTYYAYVSVGGNLSFSEYVKNPKAAITTTTAKPEWKEITPDEITTSNISYKLFDKDQIKNDAFIVFKGTIKSIKEYEVERITENGEELNPVKKTIVEVQVGDVYYGNTEKRTIRIYNQGSFSNHYNGSFILRENSEYIFVTCDIDDDTDNKYDVRSHADTMSMGLRDGVMPVIDDIVSVYYEYFNDDEAAMAKAIPQEEVLDKMPDEARGKWFLTYNEDDFVELLVQLLK